MTEMVGDGCECWVTPESGWFYYGSAVEPGSQVQWNPDCPQHPPLCLWTDPTAPGGAVCNLPAGHAGRYHRQEHPEGIWAEWSGGRAPDAD